MPAIADPERTAAVLRRRIGLRPRVAIILGSGFNHAATRLEIEGELPYAQLRGFLVPKVGGHAGKLLAGRLAGVPVLVLCGRAHYYEGHSMEQVTFPVRVLARFGVKDLLLTNAAGGINRRFRPGDFMCLKDHINLMGVNPLRGIPVGRVSPSAPSVAQGRGEKEQRRKGDGMKEKPLPLFPFSPFPPFPVGALGETRPTSATGDGFVDLSQVYDPGLARLLERAARRCHVRLHKGVYLAVSGPSYETPAEIRAFARLGADAVGMSTVPEAIVAQQCGLRVAGLSCITNLAAGRAVGPLSHNEVLAQAGRAGSSATELLAAFAELYAESQ
jgi:purine-nucleoside phosphorylase